MKEYTNISIGKRFACFLIGWNAELLQECGESSHRTLRKYMSAIIILSIIWGTIGYCFAERYIGLDPIIGKLATSLVFITIIVCVERYIILTGHLSKLMAGVRILLAFLMATLGATIFDQIIFKNDVDFVMKEILTEKINEEVPRRNQIIDNDLNALQFEIDSINLVNDSLNKEINKKPIIKITAISTDKIENGKDENGKATYTTNQHITTNIINNPLTVPRDANNNLLEKLNKRKDDLQNQKLGTEKTVREEYESAPIGFLQELEALFKIIWNNIVALIFYIVLFLFLMFLEMLIVLSKGSEGDSDYDLIVQHQQRIKAETLKRMENGLLSKNNSNKSDN